MRLPRALALTRLLTILLILIAYTNALKQNHLLCKQLSTQNCLVWLVELDITEENINNETARNILPHCGLINNPSATSHEQFVKVTRIFKKRRLKKIFCNKVVVVGRFNNWKDVRNTIEIQKRVRRQSFRGRYRGQTQSQYLAIDRGSNKDEGRAEAHSAADSSRASVSGNSGMGQAQSQSVYDPTCDDCYGKPYHEIENLKRPMDFKPGNSGTIPNSGSTWSSNEGYKPIYTQNNGYNPNKIDQYNPIQRNPNTYGSVEGPVFGGNIAKPNDGTYKSIGIAPKGPISVGNGNFGPTNGANHNGRSPERLPGEGIYKPTGSTGNNGNGPIDSTDTGNYLGRDINGNRYSPSELTGNLGPNQGNAVQGDYKGPGIDNRLRPNLANNRNKYEPDTNDNFRADGSPGFPDRNIGSSRGPENSFVPNHGTNVNGYDPRQGGVGQLLPQNSDGINYSTGPNRPYDGSGAYGPEYRSKNTNQELTSSSGTAYSPEQINSHHPISGKGAPESSHGPDSRMVQYPNTNFPMASGTYPVPGGNVYCCFVPNNGQNNNYPNYYPYSATWPGKYRPGGAGEAIEPGGQYGPSGVTVPGGQYGPGGDTSPGGQYGPGGISVPGQYGIGGVAGPEERYRPSGAPKYGPGVTTGPEGKYGHRETSGPGSVYQPGGVTGPGGNIGHEGIYGPGGVTGSGGQLRPGGATAPGGQYMPGSGTGSGGQYGPDNGQGLEGTYRPGGQYTPGGGGQFAPGTGPGGQYGSGGAIGPGGQYGPVDGTGPGGQYGPGAGRGPGEQYGTAGTAGPAGVYRPGGVSGPGGPSGSEGQNGPGGVGGPGQNVGPGGQYGPGDMSKPGGQFGPGGTPGPGGQYIPGGGTHSGEQYGPGGTIGPRGQYGPGGATGPDGTIGPGGVYRPDSVTGPGGVYGPGGDLGPVGAVGPGGIYGPGGITGTGGTAGPGGVYGPGGITGTSGPAGPDGVYGPGGITGTSGTAGPGGIYRPGGVSGSGGTTGQGGVYGPGGVTGSGGTTGPGGSYGPGGVTGTSGTAGPGGVYGPGGITGTGGPTAPGGLYGPGGISGPSGTAGPEGVYGPGSVTKPGGTTGPGGVYGPGGITGPGGTTGPGGVYGPNGVTGSGGTTGPGGVYGPGGVTGTGGTTGPGGVYGPGSLIGSGGSTGPEGVYGPGGVSGSGGTTGPGGIYRPGVDTGPVGTTGPGGVYSPGGVTGPGGTTGPGGVYGPGGVIGPGGISGPGGIYGPGSVTRPGETAGPGGIYEPGGATGPGGQYGTDEYTGLGGQYGPGTRPTGANQGATRGPNGEKEIPQNYLDPNSISGDGDDSEAEANVAQNVNGTTASASSKGGNEKGRAQTSVQGTYTGTGSFQAQAQITGENKEAQSEVSGGKKGASSSASGSGRNNKSQANVQLGSETGSVQTQSQSNGIMHSSNSQVQGSVKGGMADAQARGPGSTSSQAQIGFTPYKDEDKSTHDLQRIPFSGGGMASAQSSGRTGQSQSQLHGTFKYGITYNGAAQSGASLDKDTVFPNRLTFEKINVFDEKEKNINVDRINTDITEPPHSLDTETSPPESAIAPGSNDNKDILEMSTTDNVLEESMKNSESRYSGHTHLDHHTPSSTNAPYSNGPTLSSSRRSFPSNYGTIPDYEYTTDKDETQAEYDTDVGYEGDGNEINDGEPNEYSNYDEYSRDTPTHQYLQSSNRKGLEVQQTTGGNTQHIIVGSLKDHNAEIIQRDTERPDENKVYQPGERVPGTGGYTIPVGFTGSVKSVASKDKTYVVGSRESPSQAQTVTLTPGTGKIKYIHPSSHGKYVKPKNLRSLQSPIRNDDNRYISVSKSVTRALDSDNNIRKQYSHTYYTKSSSCGYFTFTCTMVSSAEGRKKVCRPKMPTNPDGTPIRC